MPIFRAFPVFVHDLVSNLGQSESKAGFVSGDALCRMDKTVNIDIIAGDRVAPCIAHDAPFASDPMWVRYETANKRLSIVFEDGAARPIPTAVNDEVARRLRFSRKIMLVQLRDGRPIEGYECRLRTFDEVGNELATA